MKVDHNRQKKIAIINDFSGFGRCSISVALPIISVMGVQGVSLPTAVFSNHTGFDSYFFDDYTKNMRAYIDEWRKLDLQFSGICTGFLGSKDQIDIVTEFFDEFKTEDNIIVIDPVMGDYGKTYDTYTPEMCERMKDLVKYADILSPNLTEACILTETPYKERWKIKELFALADKLVALGPQKIVITGIPQGSFVSNLCFAVGKEHRFIKTHRVGESRSGTGDIFAAILAADAVNGLDFLESVKKASRFIKKCINRSIEMGIPLTDGVAFEEVLYTLRDKKK